MRLGELTIPRLLRLMLRPVMRPMHRWWIRRVDVEDPWEPVTSFMIRPALFGAGSTKPFQWYLEGESNVRVASVDDITNWLAACEYASDPDLFNEPDFWQHPRTFEHLRKGDCEDHALWAWRKLLEIQIVARLVVGQWLSHPRGRDTSHAWIIYDSEGGKRLLEPVAKEQSRMVRALAEARGDYVPHYSVGGDGRMVAHAGLLLHWRQQEERRRSGRGSNQAA